MERHIVHQSLVVPNLVWGAERSLAHSTLIAAAALTLGVGLHWYTLALATALLTVGMGALRQLAKYDPQFSWVYMRHRGQQDIYPPTGSLTSAKLPVYISIPSRRDISGWKVW